MRKGTQGKQLILDGEGRLVAIRFGFDFCCEHECGTKGFYEAFGISGPAKKKQGVKSRRVRKFDENDFLYKEFEEDVIFVWDTVLGYSRRHGWEKEDTRYKTIPRELQAYKWKGAKEEDLRYTTAWTSGPGSPSFGIRFRKEEAGILKDLHEAFARKDVSIWTMHDAFGGRGGLVLAITSKVPEEVDQVMVEGDLDNIKLQEAADATGIKQKIDTLVKAEREAATGYITPKFYYYALSPGWKLNERVKGGKIDTKHDVMFFLNPGNQKDNNFGWFTVEELEQWLDGKGPIPKR